MITITHKGNFDNTLRFLKRMNLEDVRSILDRYGRRGVDALRNSTPVDTGKTADSWRYEIHSSKSSCEIVWTNDNVNDGVPVAILIQYGHATKNGGYVSGIDYINPALAKVFSEMADEVWREVTRR